MEMRLIVGKLLWHFDVEMPDGGVNDAWDPEGDHRHRKVYTNWIKPPLWMKLVPRGTRKGRGRRRPSGTMEGFHITFNAVRLSLRVSPRSSTR